MWSHHSLFRLRHSQKRHNDIQHRRVPSVGSGNPQPRKSGSNLRSCHCDHDGQDRRIGASAYGVGKKRLLSSRTARRTSSLEPLCPARLPRAKSSITIMFLAKADSHIMIAEEVSVFGAPVMIRSNTFFTTLSHRVAWKLNA